VELEADAVRTLFQNQDYIPAQVKFLSTDEATYEVVCAELSSKSYDIIHYAGHGWYNPNDKDASAIFFWNNQNPRKRVAINAPELTNLLSSSGARLVYLSCCSSSASGADDNDKTDDFLGLADAVIQAGVPSVLGFRAPVVDRRAIKLATYFYQYLLERGSMEVALWDARRKLAVENRDDPTWLAPILISQY
jgi:CHAT domain-containing protein